MVVTFRVTCLYLGVLTNSFNFGSYFLLDFGLLVICLS